MLSRPCRIGERGAAEERRLETSILRRKVTPRDDALHFDPSPGRWEWWYFDADFDNGYVIAGTYHFGSPRPPANPDARFIEIGIYSGIRFMEGLAFAAILI